MRFVRAIPCLLALVFCSLWISRASADLIGLSSFSKTLYSVNEATGAATSITTINESASLVGLGYLGGTLYGSDLFQNGANFGSINTSTGAVTNISSQGGSVNWWALAPNTTGNFFYTVANDQAGDPLKTVTPTGVITTIGSTNLQFPGLAYDSITNVLYGASNNGNLYTINTTNGAVSLVGSLGLGINNLSDLAFDPTSDTLFFVDEPSTNAVSSLYTVNLLTGAATLVGSTGVSNLDGLAFASTPLPAALPLFATGLAGLGLLGWRRKRKTRLA
jgi:hypothetical protein